MSFLSLLKNSSRLGVISFICLALWGLNARNSQLESTLKRVETLASTKDEQISELRAKNVTLAEDVDDLAKAVKRQNDLMIVVTQQRSATAQHNRTLQDEIKKFVSADDCFAARVPSDAVNRLREAAALAGGVYDREKDLSRPPAWADKRP